MRHIQWNGYGTRQAYGKTWENGDVIPIESDDVADDLLTQPFDNFVEVFPAAGGKTNALDGIGPAIKELLAKAGSSTSLASNIDGIGPATEKVLAEAGILDVSGLAGLTAEGAAAIAEQTGVNEERLAGWINQAKGMA